MTCLLCDQSLSSQLQFLSIFFMRAKEGCVCTYCQSTFERLAQGTCARCLKPCQQAVCEDCQLWERKGEIVSHKALYRYNEAMKAYFSRFKFQGDYVLAELFAKDFKKALKSYKGYTFVPVPLSDERYQERGFNQVTAFLDFANISYASILEKKDAVKQSSQTRQERLANKQCFSLKKEVVLPDKILIIDDIYTTGMTIFLIKSLFREKNVKEIKSFSLCR